MNRTMRVCTGVCLITYQQAHEPFFYLKSIQTIFTNDFSAILPLNENPVGYTQGFDNSKHLGMARIVEAGKLTG